MSDVDLQQFWAKKLQGYADKPWAQKPSLFAEEIAEYLPKVGDLLELGAGNGYDGAWFADTGFRVTQTDFVLSPVMVASERVTRKIVDMTQPLPFTPNSFDVVYASLSLHYFDLARTKQLFQEVYQILKPDGVFAFLVNSTADPELGTGDKIETNFYEIDGTPKRYFDLELAQELVAPYETVLLDNNGTSYKDREEGLNHLIRFVGKKPG